MSARQSNTPPAEQSAKAAGFALAAYGFWGLVPVYWKALGPVDPIQVLGHRVVWSVVFVSVLISSRALWRDVFATFRSLKTVGVLIITSILISANWGLFIWAVQTGQLVESSLGYYINPLVNVLLGVLFLREKLRPIQLIAVGLAFVGVANQTISLGVTPWLSLVLAGTFGAYGLLRKVTPVAPMVGLFVETALVSPVAFIFLSAKEAQGVGILGNGTLGHGVLLALCGVITALPLIWFAKAAKGLRLSTLGLIQYVSPTLQLLLAVILYGEKFTKAHIVTFAFIWTALLLYSGEAQWLRRRRSRHVPSFVQKP